jgi:hypothetical protein
VACQSAKRASLSLTLARLSLSTPTARSAVPPSHLESNLGHEVELFHCGARCAWWLSCLVLALGRIRATHQNDSILFHVLGRFSAREVLRKKYFTSTRSIFIFRG